MKKLLICLFVLGIASSICFAQTNATVPLDTKEPTKASEQREVKHKIKHHKEVKKSGKKEEKKEETKK